MLESIQAFMEHLIDYAGMFPPARLPLAEALRHYTQLRATPDGIFCPVLLLSGQDAPRDGHGGSG